VGRTPSRDPYGRRSPTHVVSRPPAQEFQLRGGPAGPPLTSLLAGGVELRSAGTPPWVGLTPPRADQAPKYRPGEIPTSRWKAATKALGVA
jgi:hypothetical protein